MFEQEDALPCAEREMSVHHGNHLRRPRQRHAQVAWRVIRAFAGVDEVRRVFRHQMIEKAVQIRARGWIGVLKDHQARARVLHEHRGRAGADAALAYDLLAALRDLVSAFAPCWDGKLIGVSGHAQF